MNNLKSISLFKQLKETFEKLNVNKALTHLQKVFNWFKQFERRKPIVDDKSREGCFISAITACQIDAIRLMIKDEARWVIYSEIDATFDIGMTHN